MGINWGIAAGGAADGYAAAQELSIKKAAARRAEEEHARKRKEWDAQDDVDAAAAAIPDPTTLTTVEEAQAGIAAALEKTRAERAGRAPKETNGQALMRGLAGITGKLVHRINGNKAADAVGLPGSTAAATAATVEARKNVEAGLTPPATAGTASDDQLAGGAGIAAAPAPAPGSADVEGVTVTAQRPQPRILSESDRIMLMAHAQRKAGQGKESYETMKTWKVAHDKEVQGMVMTSTFGDMSKMLTQTIGQQIDIMQDDSDDPASKIVVLVDGKEHGTYANRDELYLAMAPALGGTVEEAMKGRAALRAEDRAVALNRANIKHLADTGKAALMNASANQTEAAQRGAAASRAETAAARIDAARDRYLAIDPVLDPVGSASAARELMTYLPQQFIRTEYNADGTTSGQHNFLDDDRDAAITRYEASPAVQSKKLWKAPNKNGEMRYYAIARDGKTYMFKDFSYAEMAVGPVTTTAKKK